MPATRKGYANRWIAAPRARIQRGNYPCGSLRSRSTRPYTFIVLALLILLISPLVILRTPVDIFPNVNIPVIAVAVELHRPRAPRKWKSASHRHTSACSPPRSPTSSTSNRRPWTAAASPRSSSIPARSVDMAMAQMTAVAQGARPADAARHHAAFHAGLQRFQRSHPATGAFRRRTIGAATVRLTPPTSFVPSWSPSRARPFPGPTAASSAR